MIGIIVEEYKMGQSKFQWCSWIKFLKYCKKLYAKGENNDIILMRIMGSPTLFFTLSGLYT